MSFGSPASPWRSPIDKRRLRKPMPAPKLSLKLENEDILDLTTGTTPVVHLVVIEVMRFWRSWRMLELGKLASEVEEWPFSLAEDFVVLRLAVSELFKSTDFR